MDLVLMYLEGLGMNLLLTALSCIIPLIFGVVFILISKTHIITHRIVKLLSQFGECLSPLVVLFFAYFGLPYALRSLFGLNATITSFWACTIGFSICFLGFLPARQKSEYSIIKNILVNTVDLISTVFTWSFVASVLGCNEMLNVTRRIVAFTFHSEYYLIPLAASFVVLVVLKTIKYLLEEFMK